MVQKLDLTLNFDKQYSDVLIKEMKTRTIRLGHKYFGVFKLGDRVMLTINYDEFKPVIITDVYMKILQGLNSNDIQGTCVKSFRELLESLKAFYGLSVINLHSVVTIITWKWPEIPERK